MVCKEELFMWFRNLRGSKRIEAMCGLLNMCYPLELRFYGTCLEDLGRRDFYAFREQEVKANNISEIIKMRNINDSCIRSRLIVILSLLNSSNVMCSKEVFKILTEEINIETMLSLGMFADMRVVDEFLLLLAIAQNHPAFSFDQQNTLSELSISLENCAREINPRFCNELDEELSLSSPILSSAGILSYASSQKEMSSNSLATTRDLLWHNKSYESQQHQSHITNLKVKPPHKKMCIRIRVAWGNNRITDAFKTPIDLAVFHQKLIQLFPLEAQITDQEKYIPLLPHNIATWNKQNALNENIISCITDYIQQLNTRLPSYIMESNFVANFFAPSFHNRTNLLRCSKNSEIGPLENVARNPRLKSFTIYNSQISDNSTQRSENRKSHASLTRKAAENMNNVGKGSPLNSPFQSPLSSPYVSPVNSETNSRSASPWNHGVENCASNIQTEISLLEKILIKEQLHHYWETLKHYRIEELQAMPNEEFESLGILKEASAKLRKILDNKSFTHSPNGVISGFPIKTSIKPGLLPHPASNDSSPVCSEYSSPPQSPSPGDVSIQNNFNTNGEEISDKRLFTKTLADLCKIEEGETDSTFKHTEEDGISSKTNVNRSAISVLPFTVPYSSIITQIPPLQNIKPSYLSIPCRTNNVSQHISPGAVVFDNQFSRVPLPSALTFLPGPPRSLAVTPDRVLSANLPISSVSPFPATSGCTTLPSSSCTITTLKSSNLTAVTNSATSSNRHSQKNSSPIRDDLTTKVVQQPIDSLYTSGYILTSTAQLTAVSCSCFSSTNSARPSPAPSPSLSPGATPQPSAVSVSLPYIGMPYVFHHSIPFLQAQPTANGFVPQPGLATAGQSFSYAIPNGLAAIPPELIYAHTFNLQSPSSHNTPGQVATPSQCYGAFQQTTNVPVKIISCYNCGKVGHRGPECKEQNMDELSKPGKFQLNFAPIPKNSENPE